MWGIETCDACGTSTKAKWVAFKDAPDGEMLILTFCSHHAGTHVMQLRLEGWTVDKVE